MRPLLLLAAPAGAAADTRALVRKAREIAAEFEFDNGYAIPVAHLAKKLADENQVRGDGHGCCEAS